MSRACPHGLCLLDAGHDGGCVEPDAPTPEVRHPSWTASERAWFFRRLGELGYRYELVAAFLAAVGQPRVKAMDGLARRTLIRRLEAGDVSAYVRVYELRHRRPVQIEQAERRAA